MTEQNILLQLTDLRKYYPLKKEQLLQKDPRYVRAIDGITLSIYEGETLGLVGESGCGKSTLGRVLLKLSPQTDGTVHYYGRSWRALWPLYLKKYITQLPRLLRAQQKQEQTYLTLCQQWDALTSAQEQAALRPRLDAAKKASDTAKKDLGSLFGGLVCAADLGAVSKALLEEYHAGAKLLSLQEQGQRRTLRQEARRGKIATTSEQDAAIARQEARLLSKTARVEQLRAQAAAHPAFAAWEALREDGVDLSKLRKGEMRKLRKDLQIIFQDPYGALNPRMSAGQMIGEGLVAHGLYRPNSDALRQFVRQVMDECGLAPYMMHRYPHQFSGGQRQRIGIARALALRPKLVVCDEAVSALDVSIQSQILNLLQDLKEQIGLTYLFISHDLSVVKYISDRIGVMYLGRLVELAETKDLFAAPRHPYTQALLAAIPTTDAAANKEMPLLEGDMPSPVRPPSGCPFHTRCRYARPICQTVPPPWEAVSPGHFVSCHFKDCLPVQEEGGD